jgi:hypothetical protein
VTATALQGVAAGVLISHSLREKLRHGPADLSSVQGERVIRVGTIQPPENSLPHQAWALIEHRRERLDGAARSRSLSGRTRPTLALSRRAVDRALLHSPASASSGQRGPRLPVVPRCGSLLSTRRADTGRVVAMLTALRIALQIVLLFLLVSLVIAVASARTGIVEKAMPMAACAGLVWVASRARRIGAPLPRA